MDFDYTETMLKILGKNKFKKMVDEIKEKRELLIDDKIINEYCEIIFIVGVSKAFRDDCLSEKIKIKLQKLDFLDNIVKIYKEYIDEVIKFCVEQHDKCTENHLYTELDEFIKLYELKI